MLPACELIMANVASARRSRWFLPQAPAATVAASLDGADRGPVADAGLAEPEALGQLDVELVDALDRRRALQRVEREHVAAVLAVVGQEVEVVAGHLQTCAGVREPEAHEAPARRGQAPLGLVAGHLGERRVRRASEPRRCAG